MAIGFLEQNGYDGGAGQDPWGLAGGTVGNSNTTLDPTGRYGSNNMAGFLDGGGGGGLDLSWLTGGGGVPTGGGGSSSGIPGVDLGVPGQGLDLNALPKDADGSIDWTKILTSVGGLGGLLGVILKGGNSGSAGGGTPGATTGSSGNLNSIASLLGSLFGTGAGVYGAVNNLQQQNWDNSGKINVLNELRRLSSGAEGQASAINGELLPALVKQLTQGQAGSANNQDITDRLKYLYNFAPDAYNATTSADRIPGLQGAFDYLGGAQGANNSALQTAFGQLQSGPNGLTGQAQQAGSNALATRGMTPEIAAVMQQAQQLLQPRSELTTANKTAESILGKQPLLPMDQAVSLAVNGAATDARNQFDTLRKQLLDRTGITGPAIATGNLNDFLSQSGDTALQQVAAARAKAISDQQGLQLQQFNSAGNLLGTAANAGQGYAQTGLQGLLQSLTQAQNRESTLPAVFGSLFGQDTSRLGTNYQGVTSLLNNAGDLNQQRINSVMGLQNFGAKQNNDLMSTLTNLLGVQQGTANSQNSAFGTSSGQLQDTLKTWANFLSNSGNSQANLFNSGNNIPNPFASLLTGGK